MSVDTLFVKMHTGDPGAGGTANAAVNATRKQLVCGDVLNAAGQLVQEAPINYTGGEVTTTETYAWVSYWDAVTGGNWLGNEDIANQAATAASPLTIPAGTITVTPSAQGVVGFALTTEITGWRAGGAESFRRLAQWRGSQRANAYFRQQLKFAKQSPQKAQ